MALLTLIEKDSGSQIMSRDLRQVVTNNIYIHSKITNFWYEITYNLTYKVKLADFWCVISREIFQRDRFLVYFSTLCPYYMNQFHE